MDNSYQLQNAYWIFMKYQAFNELSKAIPEDIARLASVLHYQGTQQTMTEISMPDSQIDDLFCIKNGRWV
jgi:hypothetical protein